MKALAATLRLSLFLALAALAAPAAMAADAPAKGDAGFSACKTDLDKLCPGTKPGDGRVKACFKEHKDQLSAECKKEIAAQRKSKKTG